MGYFPVKYDSRVVNYERRGFIRLVTDQAVVKLVTVLLCSGTEIL